MADILPISDRGYAAEGALVSTDWVAAHLNDPKVRIVESNEDPLLYKAGHIPGAVEIDWVSDLNNRVNRDYLNREQFETLMSKLGISNDTLVVFYGDKSNWWAAYALWVFKLFGHEKCALMDGGSLAWKKENRSVTREVSSYTPATYKAQARNDQPIRAMRDEVMKHVERRGALIDVRSPAEYSGERLHMEGYPNEGALRGGHIPGANNIPWAQAVDAESGTFKSAADLRKLYAAPLSKKQDELIVYCRIGERSSHTWFALTYLLGEKNVRNYDGSWTEWGNLVGAPIEK